MALKYPWSGQVLKEEKDRKKEKEGGAGERGRGSRTRVYLAYGNLLSLHCQPNQKMCSVGKV